MMRLLCVRHRSHGKDDDGQSQELFFQFHSSKFSQFVWKQRRLRLMLKETSRTRTDNDFIGVTSGSRSRQSLGYAESHNDIAEISRISLARG